MKLFFSLLLCFIVGFSFAQVPNLTWGKTVKATEKLIVGNKTISGISSDSSTQSKSDSKLITEKAAKEYADNRTIIETAEQGYLFKVEQLLPNLKFSVDSAALDSTIRAIATGGNGTLTTLQQAFDNTISSSENGITVGEHAFVLQSTDNQTYLHYGYGTGGFGLTVYDNATGNALLFKSDGLQINNTGANIQGSVNLGSSLLVNDSIIILKYKNNTLMDSVLTTDVDGTVRFVPKLLVLKNAPEFVNNTAALAASAAVGSVYKLPFDSTNDRQLIAMVAPAAVAPPATNLIFNVGDGVYVPSCILAFNAAADLSGSVNWGDGTIESFSGNSKLDLAHNYATVGQFTANVFFDDYALVNYMQISNGGAVSSVDGLMLCNNMVGFAAAGNLFTSFNTDVPTSCVEFAIINSLLTSFVIKNPFTTLQLNNNQLTSLTAINNAGSSINALLLGGNLLTSLNENLGLSDQHLGQLDISDNNLDVNGVNNALIYLRSLAYLPASYYLRNQKTGVTIPTGTAIDAKSQLINDFACKVETD